MLFRSFEQVADPEKAEKDAVRMLKGEFTLDDFKSQLKMIKSMGSLKDVMSKLPFMDELMQQLPSEALDDYELVRVESMIDSMTLEERRFPEKLNESRMKRIAKGSGRNVSEVKDLYERFKLTRTMMKDVGTMSGLMGNAKQARAMQRQMAQMAQAGGMGGMPGLGGPGALPAPALTMDKAELEARRRKAKDARKARKKQRR